MTGKPTAILQELESDDEFPDTYNDLAIPPAYLNDNRFEKIKFPWVDDDVSYEDMQSETKLYENHHNKVFHNRGVLKGQDIYCLQSVQSLVSSTTFIWFVNFLLQKDIHSPYTYLKSCLVNDPTSAYLCTKKNYDQIENENIDKDRFQILIKSNYYACKYE